MPALSVSWLLDAAAASEPVLTQRRHIKRADNGWRGSTIAGYLYEGDEITFYQKFRMPREGFDHLVKLIRPSAELEVAEPARVPASTPAQLKRQLGALKARRKMQRADLEFKVAACLYAIGQGGPMATLADALSVGTCEREATPNASKFEVESM